MIAKAIEKRINRDGIPINLQLLLPKVMGSLQYKYYIYD